MSLPYARIPRRERTKSWRKLRGNRKEEITRESEAAKNNGEKKQRRQVSLSAMNSEHYIFRRTYFVICDGKKNEKLRKMKRKKIGETR